MLVYTIDMKDIKTGEGLVLTGHPTYASAAKQPLALGCVRVIAETEGDLINLTDGALRALYKFKSPDPNAIPPAGALIPVTWSFLNPSPAMAAKVAKEMAKDSKPKIKRNNLTKPARPLNSDEAEGNPAKSNQESDMETAVEETKSQKIKTVNKKTAKKKAAKAKVKAKAKAKAKTATPRGDKVLAVGKLLTRAKGATRKQILELTGWKAVSVQQQAAALGMKLRIEKKPGEPMTYFCKP